MRFPPASTNEPTVLSAAGMQSFLHWHSFSFIHFTLAWPRANETSRIFLQMRCACKRNLAGAEGWDKTLTVWPWYCFFSSSFLSFQATLCDCSKLFIVESCLWPSCWRARNKALRARSWRNGLMTLMSALMHLSVWTWWVCNKTRHSGLESVVLQTSQKNVGFIWKMSCVCLNSMCLPKCCVVVLHQDYLCQHNVH